MSSLKRYELKPKFVESDGFHCRAFVEKDDYSIRLYSFGALVCEIVKYNSETDIVKNTVLVFDSTPWRKQPVLNHILEFLQQAGYAAVTNLSKLIYGDGKWLKIVPYQTMLTPTSLKAQAGHNSLN